MKISTYKLKKIRLEDGDLLHGLRKSESSFDKFGELYFSWIKPGRIKAWKKHKAMTSNLMVPYGLVKFVFCKDIINKDFEELIIGNSIKDEDKYYRLTINPSIWFGFMGISSHNSLVVNLANMEHSPEEVDSLDLNSLKYDW